MRSLRSRGRRRNKTNGRSRQINCRPVARFVVFSPFCSSLSPLRLRLGWSLFFSSRFQELFLPLARSLALKEAAAAREREGEEKKTFSLGALCRTSGAAGLHRRRVDTLGFLCCANECAPKQISSPLVSTALFARESPGAQLKAAEKVLDLERPISAGAQSID